MVFAQSDVTAKNSSQPYSNFTVSIACTTLTQLPTVTFGSPLLPGSAQVFNGTYNTTIGWNTVVFQNPYAWDGTSDLIVEICFDNTSFTSDDDVQSETTVFPSVLEFETDAAAGCSAKTERTKSNRPVIRFTTYPISAVQQGGYVWTPPVGFINGNNNANPASLVAQGSITYRVEVTKYSYSFSNCNLWYSYQRSDFCLV